MKTSPLTSKINQLSVSQIDASYAVERLANFTEGSLFYPTNGHAEDYSICMVLADHHLIERITTPRWSAGGFRGLKVGFRYRHDLNY